MYMYVNYMFMYQYVYIPMNLLPEHSLRVPSLLPQGTLVSRNHLVALLIIAFSIAPPTAIAISSCTSVSK